jgi:hypothetical protein
LHYERHPYRFVAREAGASAVRPIAANPLRLIGIRNWVNPCELSHVAVRWGWHSLVAELHERLPAKPGYRGPRESLQSLDSMLYKYSTSYRMS